MKEEAVAFPADHPHVSIFPPLIPLAGFFLGMVLERVMPLSPWVAGPLRNIVRSAGSVVFVSGVAGFAWMIVTMKRAGTPIHNRSTPTVLVESGPFRFSRNPMYVFGSIWYAGLALVLVEPWSLALLIGVVITTHYRVVLKEEAFLQHRFGDAYQRYKARVPRYW